MANTIVHKLSAVSGVVPQPTDIIPGELAINTADGILFIKNEGGTVFAINNTSNITEGSNLFYTNERARTAISASGDLSYNNVTGEISFTERTVAEVRGLISATGDLSYNNVTGEMSVTIPAVAPIADQDLNTTDNVVFNDVTVNGTFNSDDVTATTVTISGNLTVSGTTTTVNSTELSITDSNIVVANGSTDDATANGSGITFGAHTGAGVMSYNSGTDNVDFNNLSGITASLFTGNLSGNATSATTATSATNATQLDGNSSSYYAPIANPNFTGNVTVSGTVNGRDLASDGTSLDTLITDNASKITLGRFFFNS